MANGLVDFELKEGLQNLPPEIINSIGNLVYILKAAGILLILYIIFIIIKGYFDIKRSIRIKNINEKIDEMNDKLDVLINKGKKKKS